MAPGWLLLRGLGRETRHWHDFPRQLSRAAGSARVVAVDLPGFGAAAGTSAPTSIRATAARVCATLEAEYGSTERRFVVGLSLGGMVALELAALRPDSLAGVAIVNSSAGTSPPWRRLRPGALAVILRAAATRDELARERLVLALTTHLPEGRRRALAELQAGFARTCRPSRSALARQLLAAARFRPARPLVPVHVIASLGDRLVSPDCSRELAARLGATLSVHPTAGHDLPLDAPGWLARELATWAAHRAQSEAARPSSSAR